MRKLERYSEAVWRMTNFLHEHDLPDGLDLGSVVAVDCETMGLRFHRDRLCAVQVSSGNGDAHVVQMAVNQDRAPNLCSMLNDRDVLKLFHFGRFDIAVLYHTFGALATPAYCTKIASKLVRTNTERHGLKDLLSELLQIEVSKQARSSDWGADRLTAKQIDYAASDVLYLHRLRKRLDERLVREGREELARSCFDFLPTLARLDLAGWQDADIFAH